MRRKGWLAMHIEIDEGIRSVLIVEDEMIVAMMMEDLMRELGVKDVEIAGDSASALAILASKPIDMAILDLKVRDGNTLPVADVLEERGIPFVFSSGSGSGFLSGRHAARPMISKPFFDDDFKLIVLDTWTLSQSAQQLGAQGAGRVAPSGATD
jgi:CheY-like chemotaxis protein